MSPEHFARMRGLQAAYTSSNSRLLDHPDIARQLDGKLKRVQFDTLPEFSEPGQHLQPPGHHPS